MILKLDLLSHDLNSESYAFDSRSYLLPLLKEFASKEPLEFFTENFIPLADELSNRME
jgi:hypothetical protein